jgi:hypothetical protein
MNPIEFYNLWAPEASTWSNWAKPVLFAQQFHAGRMLDAPAPNWREFHLPWAPDAKSGSAVILDLPGDDAIWRGMALALRGFRPVPVYNGTSGPAEIVSTRLIVGALQLVAEDLAKLPIDPNAPPAFLLDANRSGGSSFVGPGRFDNRWFAFPEDFPSGNFLLAKGIRAVVLCQATNGQPQRDLAHVLMRWQESGIQILTCDVHREMRPEPIRVTRPGSFRLLWYRALVIAGLRRNSAGGFGAVVPEPNRSGGFG